MKWIITLGLLGWAGIVALAWRMANERIALCGWGDSNCVIRATAMRDNVLVWGLTAALVALVVVGLAAWVRHERLKRAGQGPASANRAAMRRLP